LRFVHFLFHELTIVGIGERARADVDLATHRRDRLDADPPAPLGTG
jgi:hypothetical protein